MNVYVKSHLDPYKHSLHPQSFQCRPFQVQGQEEDAPVEGGAAVPRKARLTDTPEPGLSERRDEQQQQRENSAKRHDPIVAPAVRRGYRRNRRRAARSCAFQVEPQTQTAYALEWPGSLLQRPKRSSWKQPPGHPPYPSGLEIGAP